MHYHRSEIDRNRPGDEHPSWCTNYRLQHITFDLTTRNCFLDGDLDDVASEGIYGTPTYVSSTYIFCSSCSARFWSRRGMVLFTDFAMGTVGHSRGGPAKVAVILVGPDGHDQGIPASPTW